MYIPKRYGQSKTENCPFCGRQATAKNSQEVPVCREHKSSVMNEMRCICGEHLLMMKGKFGLFFNCPNCGNMSMRKVMEFNDVKDVNMHVSDKEPGEKKEFTIRSDDPDYFD